MNPTNIDISNLFKMMVADVSITCVKCKNKHQIYQAGDPIGLVSIKCTECIEKEKEEEEIRRFKPQN